MASEWYYTKHLTSIENDKLNLIEEYAKGNCLDAACGNGRMAKYISDYGTYWGVDSNQTAVKICKKKRLRVIRADLEELPFKKDFFDTVIAFDIFEHLFFPAKAMKELNRVCKTGGLILIKTPSAFMPPEEFFVDYTHVRPFTKESLELLLRDHGFEPIYLEYGIRTVSQDNPVAKFVPKLAIPLISKLIQPAHKFLRDKTRRRGPLLGVGRKLRKG